MDYLLLMRGVLLSGGVFSICGSFAFSQEYPLLEEIRKPVLEAIDNSAEILRHHQMCPVEIYNTAESSTPMEGQIDFSEYCSASPQTCLDRCMKTRDASICFELGYVLEDNEGVIDPNYGQRLYAQACAGGWTLGCTNRAAGIRNGRIEGDPFEDANQEKLDVCLNKTFELMCEEEEAWGCFMVGQSYEYGEGRAADTAAAREYYLKACEERLDNEDACETARSSTNVLD